MKAYIKYMDNIEIPDSLHQKIISHIEGNPKQKYRGAISEGAFKSIPEDIPREVSKGNITIMKRYTAIFVCFTVVLMGLFVIPKLIQNIVKLQPDGEYLGIVPNSKTPTPDGFNKYTLNFNKASDNSLDTANIYIPGHFWHEATNDEVNVLFPTLGEAYTISAIANFQKDGDEVSLFNIDAYAKSITGHRIYIQIAPNEVKLDYIFESEVESSDVLGTKVTAGYFITRPNSKGLQNIIYFATFKLSDLAYYVELSGVEVEKENLGNEISEIIGLLIKGDKADIGIFNPIVPELKEDKLNLDDAYRDEDFGAYLPKVLPNDFIFESALRFINQEQNTLFINWVKDMDYIDWRVSILDDKEKDINRITSVADTEKYDLSLYPIPRSESVPEELREIVNNPIFSFNEVTIDTIKARTYRIEDLGDKPGPRMHFSVLYDNILVELNIKGVESEIVYEILQQIQ